MDRGTCQRLWPMAGFVLAACLAGWNGAAVARSGPAAGRLLVATHRTQGVFSETVVLLLGYGPKGAMGLIVNRPTQIALAKAVPDVSELQGRKDSIYLGGPVSLGHVTLLIRAKSPPPNVVHVFADIYASASLKALRAVAGDSTGGSVFRAYAGYAGWGAGQLDAEIQRGDWIVVPASTQAVFTEHPSRLWHRLIQRQSLLLVQAGSLPGQSRTTAWKISSSCAKCSRRIAARL